MDAHQLLGLVTRHLRKAVIEATKRWPRAPFRVSRRGHEVYVYTRDMRGYGTPPYHEKYEGQILLKVELEAEEAITKIHWNGEIISLKNSEVEMNSLCKWIKDCVKTDIAQWATR